MADQHVPAADSFEAALHAYADSIDHWAGRPDDAARALAVLLARDTLHAARHSADATAARLEQLSTLDGRFAELALAVPWFSQRLAEWRRSCQPEESAWWWSVERPPSYGLRIGSGLCLLAAGVLLADIINRFLAGGVDRSSAAATLLSIALLSLGTGSAFTSAGGQVLDYLAQVAPIRSRESLRFVIAALVLLASLALMLRLPAWAVSFSNQGREEHRRGALLAAQRSYERAISLRPDYAVAHYNAGLLYEDLLDTDAAKLAYQLAIKASEQDRDRQTNAAARNNLARLYILADEYEQAVGLLIRARDLGAVAPDIQYDLLKNLGWARVGQERFPEAAAALRQAVQLEPQSAAGHCLLAQALEGLGQADQARPPWQRCVALADSTVAEEDRWLGQGQTRLGPTP